MFSAALKPLPGFTVFWPVGSDDGKDKMSICHWAQKKHLWTRKESGMGVLTAEDSPI